MPEHLFSPRSHRHRPAAAGAGKLRPSYVRFRILIGYQAIMGSAHVQVSSVSSANMCPQSSVQILTNTPFSSNDCNPGPGTRGYNCCVKLH